MSGMPIESPLSNNNLAAITTEGTFAKKVPGVSPFLINPNSISDPSAYSTYPVLNAKAWVHLGQRGGLLRQLLSTGTLNATGEQSWQIERD